MNIPELLPECEGLGVWGNEREGRTAVKGARRYYCEQMELKAAGEFQKQLKTQIQDSWKWEAE